MAKQKIKFLTLLVFLIGIVTYLTFLDSPNNVSAQEQPPSREESQPGSEPVYCKPPLIRGDCPEGQCQVGTGEDAKCELANPAPGQLVSTADFGKLLKDLINILLMFAGAIAVIFLMVGGFQYIASRGNEEATQKAKKTITNAIIGIVLIVMSFAIVNIINTLLTKTPAEQVPKGSTSGPGGTPPGPGGGGGSPPGGGSGGGGQTQGGIEVEAVNRQSYYTQGEFVSISFLASPAGDYAWTSSGSAGIVIEPGEGDPLSAVLNWDTENVPVKVYPITVTARNNQGQSGSVSVIIDLRESAQSGL